MHHQLPTAFLVGLFFVSCRSDDADTGVSPPPDTGVHPESDSGTMADEGVPDGGRSDARKDIVTVDVDPLPKKFCDLPGSLQFVASGTVTVPGGADPSNLAFLQLPPGFCVHSFANVGNTRQLRFAPGGELFVASPTTSTTGGGPGGLAAIVVLPDDNRDGVADSTITFLDKLPSTQGLLFANDHFYYQDLTRILRISYASGDREPQLPSEQVADITIHKSGGHWPKTLDQADDGTIFVSNGSDQDEICDVTRPFKGGILKLDGSPGGTPIARGFRNPIAVRCQRGHNLCFASELSKDFSASVGGREKLVPIRAGDDWGFPCCATKDDPYEDVTVMMDCSQTTPESISFVIGDTPFGVDFEPGKWPAPYTGGAFVALHGAAADWSGARLVVITMDPATGLPAPGTNLATMPAGAMSNFATGWDDQSRKHGRPAAVTFSADGRLFLGNDNNGEIFWIAPLDLER